MLTKYIYTLLLPAVPIIGALFCFFMVGLVRAEHDRRLLKRILLIFFLSEMVLWTTVMFYSLAPGVFVYLSGLAYFSMLLTQVSFFHFVFRVTQLRSSEPFSFVHYAFPFIIAGVQGVWTLMVPFDVTLGIVESQGVPATDYPAYSSYFLFKIKMRMLYSTVYTVWALLRIYRYRKVVADYSSDAERTPLAWLQLLVFMALLLVFMPLSMVFRERSYFFTATFLMPFTTLLLLTQFALLCYNFLMGNYVQITADDSVEECGEAVCAPPMPLPTVQDDEEDVGTPLSNRNRFEAYMRDCKPYLNPQLRITDLAVDLGTNRSYLSSFINSTYGMNFSQLINRYRIEEFCKLEKECPEMSRAELAVAVGFGSYRNFARIVKASGVGCE